jgi:RNA polymerase sigma-70 factor (ECF subfamily)
MRHRGWLLAQARNLCRNASDAEDLVQETLLRFIQTFSQVEAPPDERTCGAWLVTTLTHLFYSQCRRLKAQARGAQDPLLREEASGGQEPEPRPVYDTLSEEQFAQALQALSPKVRATFELHAAGKRYQDIAQALGIPMGTVAKRLHDARAKLRGLLLQSLHPGAH